jgi:hypothetical protein
VLASYPKTVSFQTLLDPLESKFKYIYFMVLKCEKTYNKDKNVSKNENILTKFGYNE